MSEPLIRPEDESALAEDLRAEAHGLAPTFAKFEEICLRTGARLGEAAPGLGALARQFGAVSGLLDGPAMTAASRDLEAIAAEVGRAAGLVEVESRTLPELIKANSAIGQQIGALLGFVRTIAALVFTMKIESAQLPGVSQEMVLFAEALQQIANQARQALDEYQATHARLDSILRGSAAAQVEFQRKHQSALTSSANEILESVGAVSERRRRTAAALQDVGALANDIAGRIGECLVALQIGDSTRQRVEHTCSALRMAADAIEGAALPDEDRIPDEDRRPLAARIAHLQVEQLEGAREDFLHDAETISRSLAKLAEQARDLEQRGLQLFGGKDAGEGSFLQKLEVRLSSARTLVEGCRNARAEVDKATTMVAATMADLDARTGNLLQIAVDVTMIGTNASLKSARIGDAGKGIMLVAQELRSFGDQIRRAIDELPAALDRVVAFVDGFTEARRELDATRMAQLDSRMSAAIGTFGESGKGMTEALTQLKTETAIVRDRLDHAAAALGSHRDAGPKLASAVAALAPVARSLGGLAASPEVDQAIDAWLRPAYTMKSERVIHDRLTGFVAPASETVVETGARDADAFML